MQGMQGKGSLGQVRHPKSLQNGSWGIRRYKRRVRHIACIDEEGNHALHRQNLAVLDFLKSAPNPDPECYREDIGEKRNDRKRTHHHYVQPPASCRTSCERYRD